MSCSLFLAAYLSGGLGIVDHSGWREIYGRKAGIISLEQNLIKCNDLFISINADHISSIETNDDRGLNRLTFNIRTRVW